MKQRTVLAVSLSLNLALLAVMLGGWTGPNVLTSFNPNITQPTIDQTAFVHPLGAVTGNVTLGARVYVAPPASVRGDEGQPIHVGDESNVQDAVVLHGLETIEDGEEIAKNQVTGAGRKYSVYVGKRVSMAHQSRVHGPAHIGDDTFIGMQALVFDATIGDHVVVEPGAKIIGVTIAPGRYVPAGAVVTTPEGAAALPKITKAYRFNDINKRVVHVNTQLADGYNGKNPADGKH